MAEENKQKQKRTISLRQFWLTLLIVVILTVCLTFFVTTNYMKRNQANSSEYNQDLAKVSETYDEIQKNYVGKVKKDDLVNGAIKGMTAALNDPYSEYFSGKETKELDSTINGDFEGIGAVMKLQNDLPVIAEPPIKGSPAEKAKLQTDDIILEVNNKDISKLTLTETVSKIRGKKGTSVTLTVLRGKERFKVTIKRDVIPLNSVETKLDAQKKNIGIITIKSFTKNTAKEFKEAVTTIRKKGAKSFVIDVRGNPGGLLDQVIDIASMCLKNGETIVQFENREKQREKVQAGFRYDRGFKVTEPLVVLIDQDSASAAEIYAAAMKESRNVAVIGTKSFGKGVMQTVAPVSEDSELKLTTNRWLTPKGNSINKKGLKPTIERDYPDYAHSLIIDTSVNYQEGAKGLMVKNINLMLAGLGYDVDKSSNDYSAKTKTAVNQLQAKNNLPVTGILDKATALSLENQIRTAINEHDNAYNEAILQLSK